MYKYFKVGGLAWPVYMVYRLFSRFSEEGQVRFFKLLAMVSVVVGFTAYGIYLYTGKVPWQFLQELPSVQLEPPPLPKLGDVLSEVELAGQDRVYKWRDAQGTWHYTTEPPPEGVKFEILTLDENVNVIPRDQTDSR